MPRKLTKEMAILIAEKFLTNGLNRNKALQDVGYSKAYSIGTKAHRLFDNPLIKDAMADILARNSDAVDVQVSEIVRGLREIAFPADGTKVLNSDRNTALSILAKYKNMFVERFSFEDTRQERNMTETDKLEAKILAALRMKFGDAIRDEILSRSKNPPSFSDSEILNG